MVRNKKYGQKQFQIKVRYPKRFLVRYTLQSMAASQTQHEQESKAICNENESKVFNIIHFSDVYDICSDSDEKGGASRFLSALNIFKNENLSPLILFSGNFVSRSDISCITKGQHMIDIMNKLGIKCGVLGTHDFDFGENNLYKMIKELTFPIINTNILFNSLTTNLKQATNNQLIRKYFIINYMNDDNDDNNNKSLEITDNNNIDIESKEDENENNNNNDIESEEESKLKQKEKSTKKKKKVKVNGLKIGVIGVCANWLDLIEDRLDNEDDIIYQDMIESTKKYILELREEHKVDMIIALTHSKWLNDRFLADKINGIDLILSGGGFHNDHNDENNKCLMSKHTRTLIVKSGCNFKNFSWIQFMPPPQHQQYNNNRSDDDIVDNQHSQSFDIYLFFCLI